MGPMYLQNEATDKKVSWLLQGLAGRKVLRPLCSCYCSENPLSSTTACTEHPQQLLAVYPCTPDVLSKCSKMQLLPGHLKVPGPTMHTHTHTLSLP
jgi:hypothetical protein